MGLQEIKEQSRAALHNFMKRPAAFYTYPDDGNPVLRTVRAHSNEVRTGDLAGTNLSYVETHDRKETLVFWIDEFGSIDEIKRLCIVVLSANEGYRLENRLPVDGQTVTVEVVRLSDEELVGKTLPEDL